MPDSATPSRGRPRIGPKVDINIPDEIIEEVQRKAASDGVPAAEVYRNMLAAGLAATRVRVSA